MPESSDPPSFPALSANWGTQQAETLDPDADEEVEIKNVEGKKCGLLRWKLIGSEEKMWPTEFPFHRQQIPVAELFPIAFLDSIEVWPKRQGLGSKGLREFLALASTRGARVGYMRLGWDGEEDRLWKLEWYRRHGWLELRNGDPKCSVPFMYRLLGDV